MSEEELIARLRKGDTPMANHYMDEAADRIEALIVRGDLFRDAFNTNCLVLRGAEDRIEALEAKLAKAEVINGLLTVVAILNDPNDGRFPEAVDLAERFSTTLAEIKGESHE